MLQTPSGGARAGTAAGKESAPMSIGAVLEALRAEFPEVTISKIRFLEAEGLVEPARSPSGYRKFTAEDVERLAYVLRMQRDHYLPLKVIREHLEAFGEGAPRSVPPVVPPGGPEGPDAGSAAPAVRTGRKELLGLVGAEEADLAEWEEYGLLGAAEDGTYRLADVTVAQLVAELGRHGVAARHLRGVKAAADRQLDLVQQLVAPLRHHPDQRTRTRAEATADELVDLSVRLYGAFVESAARAARTRGD
ncbi:MerR family transcriptional regulator [Streptomyces oryzae]|uniref:MerR family transcriptional regulator n=1 Tax=Streptomyces oryzae TaxID=1434886 RepID=A0ABS3XC12_9ACTN|nr:MerR family transcriptional regulator [Streptomyces oryzae]MBO8192905.1 MerR family transcriptional regulator [Streptomyces oryzae]